MNKYLSIPFWKQVPFLRLLLSLTAGIILQWYSQFSFSIIITAIVFSGAGALIFSLFTLSTKFWLQPLQGIFLNAMLLSMGLMVTWQKDVSNSSEWYGRHYTTGDLLLIKIDEPLVKKAKSYKANGYVEAIISNKKLKPCHGKILLYFSRDSMDELTHTLQYGDKIIIRKNLQAITNSGNPGAFNYQRYAAFQQIFHNVFLKSADWVPTNERSVNAFNSFIYAAKAYVLTTLRKYVGSNKDELGIAEALLIGYTNDLDKDLVQAYSNTGVVHIIAISGMHLGLIYLMLVWLFAKIPVLNRYSLLQIILILGCLWTFSLMTGASASVIRAAVMFTFIAVGKGFKMSSSIFNSLAGSAFVMLCYNPFFLWDVGFQLSYLAVVGIIVFQTPIYNWLYIKDKWMDKVWKLGAISLAAQVLTFPVCIYYFHQFPNLFLLTNMIAVPLSTVILYAEIILIAVAEIPYLRDIVGKTIATAVWVMNTIVRWINEFSFAVWDTIHSTVFTTWLLYAVVVAASAWLLQKNKSYLKWALSFLLAFAMVHAYAGWQLQKQQQLIVYNVPQHTAIDFINGHQYYFIGDSILLQDGMLQNFHLKPGRTKLQLTQRFDSLHGLFRNGQFYQFGNIKLLLIDRQVSFGRSTEKIPIDVIVITHNARVDITTLTETFACKTVVLDASNSLWKIDKWLKECEQLHLRSHSVARQGAFIVNIE